MSTGPRAEKIVEAQGLEVNLPMFCGRKFMQKIRPVGASYVGANENYII